MKNQKLWMAIEKMMGQKPPLLSSGHLKSYVKKHFEKAEKYRDLLTHHQLPLYVLDKSGLIERGIKFKNAFLPIFPDSGFYFAVKSNNHPEVAKTLVESGFGLDVSSGLELETALAIGARDIVFSGPGKTDKELALAVQNADRVTLLIDSFSELARVEKLAAATGMHMRAGVRLCTMPKGLWKKFGILIEELPLFFAKANACAYVQLCGLQFHTSWNMSPKAQIKFIQQLGRVIAHLPAKYRKQIRFVDIGGGYWPEQGEWLRADATPEGLLKKAAGVLTGSVKTHFHNPATPIDGFAEKLGEAIKKYFSSIFPCRICFEPGRWVVTNAMHLFISVVDKKAPDLVICDAGTNTIGWERYEMDYCPVLNISRPSERERVCQILGALCTPHDVWGSTYFGEDIQPGDILMIPDQGAYTYSLRQHFIKPIPEVVSI